MNLIHNLEPDLLRTAKLSGVHVRRRALTACVRNFVIRVNRRGHARAAAASEMTAFYQDRQWRDWRRPAKLGYVIIILTFGVLGGWSAFARLDSAVVAPAW